MQRITENDLRVVCNRINVITGSPREPYVRDSRGVLVACIGNYHISSAYGGVCLQRMQTEGGGVDTPINSGYVTKRELYNLMHAYIQGLENQKNG